MAIRSDDITSIIRATIDQFDGGVETRSVTVPWYTRSAREVSAQEVARATSVVAAMIHHRRRRTPRFVLMRS